MVPQAEIHSSTGEKRPELGSEVGGTGGNCKEPGVAIEGERLVDGGIDQRRWGIILNSA